MNKKWQDYLSDFELTVLLPLFIDRAQTDANGIEPVPLRPGKLHKTPFFHFIGSSFDQHNILSFNYYGLFKPSTGLLELKPAPGRNTIKAPVVHFSSIKIEHIEKYNKNLLLNFVNFKKFLVSLRWER